LYGLSQYSRGIGDNTIEAQFIVEASVDIVDPFDLAGLFDDIQEVDGVVRLILGIALVVSGMKEELCDALESEKRSTTGLEGASYPGDSSYLF